MKPMKKAICLLFICLFTLTLTGCNSLPEGMEREALVTEAHKAVEMMNAGDWAGVFASFDTAMQAALPEETLKTSVGPSVAALGSFQKYRSDTVTGVKSGGVEMATVVVTAEYENSTATYTLTYTKDMKLSGLYMK